MGISLCLLYMEQMKVCVERHGSLWRLAAVAGWGNGVEEGYTGSPRGQGGCGGCLGPLTD